MRLKASSQGRKGKSEGTVEVPPPLLPNAKFALLPVDASLLSAPYTHIINTHCTTPIPDSTSRCTHEHALGVGEATDVPDLMRWRRASASTMRALLRIGGSGLALVAVAAGAGVLLGSLPPSPSVKYWPASAPSGTVSATPEGLAACTVVDGKLEQRVKR